MQIVVKENSKDLIIKLGKSEKQSLSVIKFQGIIGPTSWQYVLYKAWQLVRKENIQLFSSSSLFKWRNVSVYLGGEFPSFE